MTVGELKKRLDEYPDSLHVVASEDGEGNSFGAIYDVDIAYDVELRYGVEIETAVVIWPV